MRSSRIVARFALTLAAMAMMAIPAGATTLIRQGLETLTADNGTIVRGTVVELHSYWNDDHSMILTDVRVRPSDTFKGLRAGRDVVFTLMGGTVGDVTTLIIGNPELVPGSEYMLFLNREDLPGAPARLTVRDLVQGVFDVVDGPLGRRAVSQALRHPLMPDADGRVDVPGGIDGFAFDEFVSNVRRHVSE
jgi:hypothetical protein